MLEGFLFSLGAAFGIKESVKEYHRDTSAWCRTMSYDAKKNYNRRRQDELQHIFHDDHKRGVEILGREYRNVHPLYREFPPDLAPGYCLDAAVRQMSRREGWDWYDWKASMYSSMPPQPNSPFIKHLCWMQRMIQAEIEEFGE